MKSQLVLSSLDKHQDIHTATLGGAVTWRAFMRLWLALLPLLASHASLAEPIELGRLFYTPAQRTQLETARARNVTQLASPKQDQPASTPAPLHYDGVVIRSDGKSTRWVDGKAEVGASSVTGLKPGQIRANGKVYEPYQVLRPSPPAEPETKETAP